MRAFIFSVICLTATCFAQDRAADREPIYQPSHRPIRREIFNALRKEDAKERRTRLEELYPHIERRIERYEERPFLAMAFRLSLLHVLIELDDKRAALKAAREVVASYWNELDPDEFRAWLTCVLVSYRRDGPRERIDLLLRAASERGLSEEDTLSAMQTIDRDDWDRDGVPNRQDKCRCFDDRRDSDRDGIPDACDMCWGRPDEPDSDGDGFPDACDLCPGKTDLDRDFDNVPDGCDNITRYYNPMEPRREHVPKYRPDCECIDPPYPACCHQPESGRVWITRVEDSEGRLLESFEYTDFGEISKKTVWDGAGTPLYVTTYEFNENEQLTGHTETYPNAKTPPRTTKVFRDEEGRYIGSRVEGEDPSTIHYYDENRRRILVTTAMDPPEEEKTLERFERDAKGRILKHEKVIPETGKLEVVLTIGYIDHEDGSREVITRERINSDSERLTIEGFAKYGRRIWKKEYPTPITPRGTEPDENPLVTRYEFHSEKAPNREYPNQSEWHIKIPPSGVRQVSGWRMEGEHGKKGSLKIFESYTTTEEHPRDSDKQEWTQRTEALFEGGLYFPVEVRDPSGAVSTYRRDRDEPANVLMRREVDASGRHVETIRYEYDDEGNTIREETERDGRKRTYTTEYDDRDRVLIRGTVTDAGTMEEHTRYDSFDRIVKECVVVHSREYSMVLPNWSVSFAEADEPYVLLGHGWETLGVETDSPCKVDRANVVIRRIPRDDSEAERTETRSLSGPVFRAWVEQGGGSIDGEAKHATVTLCGGRRARIESIDITSEKQGVTETVWQLIVPARSDSEWFVMMTYTKPKVAEDGDPVCPHAEFVQVYLSSFCLDRARFDVEATLLELSNLK